VALGARALDILLTLIERRERLVTKDELLELVWPGLVVEEKQPSGPDQRPAQGLGAQTIATISGRGYRFAAALATREESPAAVAASSQAPSSIAVLRSLNTEGDPEKDYFADGMTEDIITELSRWRSLAVTSRNSTSASRVRRSTHNRSAASWAFASSSRAASAGWGIAFDLRPADRCRHWKAGLGERFDRPGADLFAVQDEVVHTIVGTLVGRMQASGADRARRKPPSSLDAYDQMLRGNAAPVGRACIAAEASALSSARSRSTPNTDCLTVCWPPLFGREWANDLSGSDEVLDRAFALAQRGAELADDESTCHTILGLFYLERRLFDLRCTTQRAGSK